MVSIGLQFPLDSDHEMKGRQHKHEDEEHGIGDNFQVGGLCGPGLERGLCLSGNPARTVAKSKIEKRACVQRSVVAVAEAAKRLSAFVMMKCIWPGKISSQAHDAAIHADCGFIVRIANTPRQWVDALEPVADSSLKETSQNSGRFASWPLASYETAPHRALPPRHQNSCDRKGHKKKGFQRKRGSEQETDRAPV